MQRQAIERAREEATIAVAPLGCLQVAFYRSGWARVECCRLGVLLGPQESWHLLQLVAPCLERERYREVKTAIARALDPGNVSHWAALKELS